MSESGNIFWKTKTESLLELNDWLQSTVLKHYHISAVNTSSFVKNTDVLLGDFEVDVEGTAEHSGPPEVERLGTPDSRKECNVFLVEVISTNS